VQHATAYSWLTLRSKIVPAVGIASKLSNIVIIIGLVLSGTGSIFGTNIFLLGIVLFAITTAFSIVTLPVEYDASNRALAWLEKERIVTQQELAGSKDALKWAARTYLVAALGSLATLLYFIMMFLNRR
jgi:hypothetical protein